MHDDDISVFDIENELESPLDRLEDPEPQAPDPEEMLPLLKSPDPQQRMVAARAFCEVRDERAIPDLIELLQEPCPLVRVSVAYALGRNTNPAVVAPLIEQLQKDWNGYVRKGLVWALGNCSDRQALAPLVHALKTDIPAVRLWAASSLGQLAPVGFDLVVGAVPPLIQGLLQDPIPAVRSNCAWALGQMCRELPNNIVYAGAIDGLIEALENDEDLSVQEDAKSSLLRVGDPRGLQIIEDLEFSGLL